MLTSWVLGIEISKKLSLLNGSWQSVLSSIYCLLQSVKSLCSEIGCPGQLLPDAINLPICRTNTSNKVVVAAISSPLASTNPLLVSGTRLWGTRKKTRLLGWRESTELFGLSSYVASIFLENVSITVILYRIYTSPNG